MGKLRDKFVCFTSAEEEIVLQPDVAKLTPAQLEDARGLLDAGMSQRQVARQFGVNHETLRRSLRRAEH